MYAVTQYRSARMSVIRSLLSVVIVSLSLYGSLAVAQTNSTVSYQGTLAFNGALVPDGQYDMTVTLYTDQSGTQPVWSDHYDAEVRAGVFSVQLGAGKPLPAPKSLDRMLWVGVRIGEGAEMRPLTQLGGVPYAMNVADKAITAEKIDADYISSISVNGRKIAGNGKSLDLASGPGMLMIYDELKNRLLLSSTGGIEGRQDPQHVSSGSGTNTANPCTTNTDGGNGFNSLVGGCNNSSTGAPTGYSSIIGGESVVASGDYSVAAGGHQNNATQYGSSLVGGEENNSIAELSFVGGGNRNKAFGGGATRVGGGSGNEVTITGGLNPLINRSADEDESDYTPNSSRYAGIDDGFRNLVINSDFSHIDGGELNTIGGPRSTLDVTEHYAPYSWIGGGRNNEIQGEFSAIPGGKNLIVGSNTLAFNADQTTNQVTDLVTNNFNQLVLFNDAPLWMGNTSGTPRGIRFYSGNSGNPTYGGGPVYTEIVSSIGQLNSITLTWPTGSDVPVSAVPSGSGSWLMSDAAGNLSWEEIVPPTMISNTGGAPNDVLTLVGPLLIPTWTPIGAQPIPFSSITSGTTATGQTLLVGGGSLLSYATGGLIDANIFSWNPAGTAQVDLNPGTGSPEVAGTLQTTNGGTGLNTVTQDGVLYGNGTGTLGVVTPPTAGSGYILMYTPGGGAPSWSAIAPSGSVNFANVLATNTTTGTNTNNLIIGTNGSLRPSGSGSTRGAIEATEFSLNVNGTTAVDLNPSSGSPEVSGQMLVANGGTGLSSVAANEILIGGSGTALGVIQVPSANGHILYFNSGGPQWQAPPNINSVLFPNIQGSSTPNAGQGTMLIGNGSSISVATGSTTGVIAANQFALNTTNGLPTVELQASAAEVSGVLPLANGGMGVGTGWTAGQVFAVSSTGTNPAWVNSNAIGSGIGLGTAPAVMNLTNVNQPNNLIIRTSTVGGVDFIDNVSVVFVTANVKELRARLGNGTAVGQLLLVVYRATPASNKSILFHKNTEATQNVIIRKSILLAQNDNALFMWDGNDWLFLNNANNN